MVHTRKTANRGSWTAEVGGSRHGRRRGRAWTAEVGARPPAAAGEGLAGVEGGPGRRRPGHGRRRGGGEGLAG